MNNKQSINDELESLKADIINHDNSTLEEYQSHNIKLFNPSEELTFESNTRTDETGVLSSKTLKKNTSIILMDGMRAGSPEAIQGFCVFFKPGIKNPQGCGPLSIHGIKRCLLCSRIVCMHHSRLHSDNQFYCVDCYNKIFVQNITTWLTSFLLFPFKFVYSIVIDFFFPMEDIDESIQR